MNDPLAHNFYVNEIAACGDASVAQLVLDHKQEYVALLKELKTSVPGLSTSIDQIIQQFNLADDMAKQVLPGVSGA